MNFNCSEDLKREHAQFVRDIQEGKLPYHYVTSACEYGADRMCGTNGGWEFVHYHKALTDAIDKKLGCKIGEAHGLNRGGGDLIVGRCAEQHAANDLLKKVTPNENNAFDVENLVFSPAIRIKSKQMKAGSLAPCINCEKIFTK